MFRDRREGREEMWGEKERSFSEGWKRQVTSFQQKSGLQAIPKYLSRYLLNTP